MRWPRLRPAQFSSGALVLAALAVGQVLNSHMPTAERSERPFEHHVEIGDTVHMRGGDLTVTSVDGAREVARDLSAVMRSPGVAIVVHFDFTPRMERSSIGYGELRDNTGAVTPFSASGERSQVSCARGPVDIVSHCFAVAEGAPGRLPGAELALGPNALDPRFDDMVVVDLGITAAKVDVWSATANPVAVPFPKVAGMP